MDGTNLTNPWMLGGGLLIVRLVIGAMMFAHGGQKLFGWLGGYGIRGTAGFFEQLGFRPGLLFATAASVGEMTSGTLIALGLLGPIGPAILISVMLVAAVSVHLGNGLFAATNGVEVPLLFATGALGLALVGPGPFSLDAALRITSLWTPSITFAALAVGVVGGLANLGLRRRPEAAAAEANRS